MMKNFKNKINYGKTFAELNIDTSLDSIYNCQQLIDINLFSSLKYGVDSINNFSHFGMEYLNPLIFSIQNLNLNLIKYLLNSGASPRGYHKFPGYPLFKVFDTYDNSFNKNIDIETKFISIVELLINYGARFDDYTINLNWTKYENIKSNLTNGNKKRLNKMFKKTPFNFEKYKSYLNIYCDDTFLESIKLDLIKKYQEKYPTKKRLSLLKFILH